MLQFTIRNKLKQKLHNQKREVFLNEREIRIAHLWQNIWYEENGKWENYTRPVIIIKRFWNQFISIPLTTKWKNNVYYWELPNTLFWKKSHAILAHIKALDRNRFSRRIWILPKEQFNLLKKKIKAVLL